MPNLDGYCYNDIKILLFPGRHITLDEHGKQKYQGNRCFRERR